MILPLALVLLAAAPDAAMIVALAPAALEQRTLSPAQVFAASDALIAAGDTADGETLLAALTTNKSLPLRSEARFRLGKLCAARGDWRAAANWYRAILTEEPDAAPVRLELAAAYAQLDDMAAARRELRRAQASPLPVAVARQVDRISDALRSDAPYGGDVSLGIAPSTNINRATSSRTINAGDIVLEINRDGRAVSGVGLATGGRGFARSPLFSNTNLLVEVAGFATIYPSGRFNDISGALTLGPEIRSAHALLRPALIAGRRSFDGRLLYDYAGGSVRYRHDLGRTAQIEATASVTALDYRTRRYLTGTSYSLSGNYEKSLDQRLFYSIGITGTRTTARDRAYATTAGGVQGLISRDFGAIVAFGGGSYSHLEGDAPYGLFGRRRSDDYAEIYAGLSAARLAVHGLMPSVKLTYASNTSSLPIYSFHATRLDLTISRAF